MDLSFQLLSSEVRLEVGGRSGPGSHMPTPVAPQEAPASFIIADIVQGWGQEFQGRGNWCLGWKLLSLI